MDEIIHGNVRRQAGELVWWEPVERLAGVAHLVMTTRQGGISQAPYDSLNLGLHVDDVAERVRLNRQAVLRAVAARVREPVVGEQVHGAGVAAVGELHAGTRWLQNEKSLAGTDALVTATRRLPLVTLVADCAPVALVDPVRQVAAAVHAGWRGLAEGVIENTLAQMRKTWGTIPADVVGWTGPMIGACCYEVGPEVARRFPRAVVPAERDRSRLDLRATVHERLMDAGLVEENLIGLPLCTSCRPDLFFSHRRATREGKPATGRQALLLWLDPWS